MSVTGWAQNNAAPAIVYVGPGVTGFALALSINSLKVSSGNETYAFYLLGSNDPAMSNGNCELLFMHDYAAAASGRVLANICGASPTVPDAQRVGDFDVFPVSNQAQGYVYSYLGLYVSLGGTSPLVTFSAWLTDNVNAG